MARRSGSRSPSSSAGTGARRDGRRRRSRSSERCRPAVRSTSSGSGALAPQPPAPSRGRRRSPCAACRCPAGAVRGVAPAPRRPAVERATGPVDVDPRHRHRDAARARHPLVVTVHDLAFLPRARRTSPGAACASSPRGIDLARRDADLVLLPVAGHARRLRRRRLRRRAAAPGAAGASRPTPADRRRRRRGPRAATGLSRPYVLWVGTVEPRKNLPDAARGLRARSTATTSTSCWSGPTGWNEDLDAPASARLGDRVRLLGFVAERRPRARSTPGPRCSAYPSLREGFGLPVLEAMAQGTPVVTSRGTPPRRWPATPALLVDPHDADALGRRRCAACSTTPAAADASARPRRASAPRRSPGSARAAPHRSTPTRGGRVTSP